jgi:hypothetical protein
MANQIAAFKMTPKSHTPKVETSKTFIYSFVYGFLRFFGQTSLLRGKLFTMATSKAFFAFKTKEIN